MALEITDKNFDEIVLKSDKPVMVDVWANWCLPCRTVGPIVDELSTEYDGKVVIGKVDADANRGVSMTYNVRSIPTMLFFKDGEVVDRITGVQPKNIMVEKLNSLL